MTLRARLLLLILLAAVPTIAIEAYSEAELRSTRQEEIRQEALRLMRLVTAEQERIDESTRQLLVGFSEGEEVHSADWAQCSETAKQVLARVEGYVNIGIATADGDLLCSGLPPPPDKDMRRQNFLEGLTPSGNLLLGRYHVGLITGHAVLMAAVPLPRAAGSVPLVAWANIDLQWLARHFADRFNSPNLTLLIADSRGTILVRLPDNAAWGRQAIWRSVCLTAERPGRGGNGYDRHRRRETHHRLIRRSAPSRRAFMSASDFPRRPIWRPSIDALSGWQVSVPRSSSWRRRRHG